MEMKAKFLNLKHFWTLMDIHSKILLIAYWINFKFFFSSSLKTNQQKNNIILICWNSDWYFDKCVKCRWWWNLLKFTKIPNKINLKIITNYFSQLWKFAWKNSPNDRDSESEFKKWFLVFVMIWMIFNKAIKKIKF